MDFIFDHFGKIMILFIIGVGGVLVASIIESREYEACRKGVANTCEANPTDCLALVELKCGESPKVEHVVVW